MATRYRIRLTSSDLDWVLHVGRRKQGVTGPLQAFNLSRPVWLDGLTQNEFMQSMRRVWLSKLSLIHQIKYGFGNGKGKPGPVDDWEGKTGRKSPQSPTRHSRLILTRQAGLGRILTHWNGPSSSSRLSDHNGYRLSIRESRIQTMHTSRHLTNDRISTKKSGLAIVVLMLVSLLATFSPQASASEIVLTTP